jgi:hypothetical protein
LLVCLRRHVVTGTDQRRQKEYSEVSRDSHAS